MICPKCAYQRTQKDDINVPDYECPNCGIIYAKYKPRQSETSKQILTNIKANRDAKNQKPAVFKIDDKPIKTYTTPDAAQPPIKPPDDGIIDGEIIRPFFSRRMQLILVIGLLCLFAAKVYMSPLSFISDFSDAIAEMPASDLQNYIDFQQLKTNIKAEVKANMTDTPAHIIANPAYQIGNVIGSKMVDIAIDDQISPANIKALFAHKKPDDPTELVFLHFDYLDFNTVKMDMDSAFITLKRQSLFGWKIIDFEPKKLLN